MTEQVDPSGPSASPQATSQGRRFYRSRSNRVLAGVCGGIAEYYGSDPTAVRLLTLVLGLFTGIFPMIVVYLVAAIVLPDHEGASSDPTLSRWRPIRWPSSSEGFSSSSGSRDSPPSGSTFNGKRSGPSSYRARCGSVVRNDPTTTLTPIMIDQVRASCPTTDERAGRSSRTDFLRA